MRELLPQQEAYLWPFMDGYVTAALWSSTDNSRDDGGDPLDQNYDNSDITDEARKHIEADCREFIHRRWDELQVFDDNGRDAAHAGHDFWLTRNGHGAGFWDRFNEGEAEAAGQRLTMECGFRTDFPEVDLYVTDDGKIDLGYLSPFV